jgi:hypothetical protein
MILRAALAACALAGAASAQTIDTCHDYRASAFAIAEPWEANTRLFANGAVRLAVTDTIEPAAGAFHLVILSPPYDELGGRTCTLVTGEAGMGLAGLTLEAMLAEYDPDIGLVFRLQARRYVPQTGDFADAVLLVTLNQATGLVTARLD